MNLERDNASIGTARAALAGALVDRDAASSLTVEQLRARIEYLSERTVSAVQSVERCAWLLSTAVKNVNLPGLVGAQLVEEVDAAIRGALARSNRLFVWTRRRCRRWVRPVRRC